MQTMKQCLWHSKGEERCSQDRAKDDLEFCGPHREVANMLKNFYVTRREVMMHRDVWRFAAILVVLVVLGFLAATCDKPQL
jgi:hypothetical protein